MTNKYILIAGATGVGKSSLMDAMQGILPSTMVFTDPYVANPFLENALTSNANKSFQSEIFFIKEFLKLHKKINIQNEKWILQERSIFECVHIFGRSYLIQGKIDTDEYALMVDLVEELSDTIRLPDIIIYLKADVSTIYNRIIHRGRDFEVHLDTDFLALQQSLYDRWLPKFTSKHDIPLYTIDNTSMSVTDILGQIKNIL